MTLEQLLHIEQEVINARKLFVKNIEDKLYERLGRRTQLAVPVAGYKYLKVIKFSNLHNWNPNDISQEERWIEFIVEKLIAAKNIVEYMCKLVQYENISVGYLKEKTIRTVLGPNNYGSNTGVFRKPPVFIIDVIR